MREYLKQNAKKRTKNKIVLNDMIRQTEEKLNRAANMENPIYDVKFYRRRS